MRIVGIYINIASNPGSVSSKVSGSGKHNGCSALQAVSIEFCMTLILPDSLAVWTYQFYQFSMKSTLLIFNRLRPNSSITHYLSGQGCANELESPNRKTRGMNVEEIHKTSMAISCCSASENSS